MHFIVPMRVDQLRMIRDTDAPVRLKPYYSRFSSTNLSQQKCKYVAISYEDYLTHPIYPVSSQIPADTKVHIRDVNYFYYNDVFVVVDLYTYSVDNGVVTIDEISNDDILNVFCYGDDGSQDPTRVYVSETEGLVFYGSGHGYVKGDLAEATENAIKNFTKIMCKAPDRLDKIRKTYACTRGKPLNTF